ncbi:CE1759 family FMN reductase [Kytococcus sp. Marseille-QA3725]
MTRRIVVVTAGLSQPSSTRLLADRIADAVCTQVSARGEEAAVEFVELRDLATDLAAVFTTGVPPAWLTTAQEQVSSADALVAVTPVFSASYSGLFKMFFDALGTDALNGMPVLIGATAGTPRHSLVLDFAMRPLFTYLRAVVVPTGVFAATEDLGGQGGDGLAGRVTRAAAELAALVVAEGGTVAGLGASPEEAAAGRGAGGTSPRRTAGTAVEQEVTPFEEMMRGLGQ